MIQLAKEGQQLRIECFVVKFVAPIVYVPFFELLLELLRLQFSRLIGFMQEPLIAYVEIDGTDNKKNNNHS